MVAAAFCTRSAAETGSPSTAVTGVAGARRPRPRTARRRRTGRAPARPAATTTSSTRGLQQVAVALEERPRAHGRWRSASPSPTAHVVDDARHTPHLPATVAAFARPPSSSGRRGRRRGQRREPRRHRGRSPRVTCTTRVGPATSSAHSISASTPGTAAATAAARRAIASTLAGVSCREAATSHSRCEPSSKKPDPPRRAGAAARACDSRRPAPPCIGIGALELGNPADTAQARRPASRPSARADVARSRAPAPDRRS